MARVVVGDSNSVIVYHRKPIQLPFRTLDRAGRDVPGRPVLFTWLSGDTIPLSQEGLVACPKRGTTVVGATYGNVFARVTVQCQPVRSVRMPGPVQFVVGDSSRPLLAEVRGTDGERVEGVVGAVIVQNPAVLRVEGGRLFPQSAGVSFLDFRVGDETGTIGVKVYEEVASLDGLRPDQELVAVSVALERGEVRSWTLPAGHWLITLRPDTELPKELTLQVAGAGCAAVGFPKGSIDCRAKAGYGASLSITLPKSSTLPALRARLLFSHSRA